MIFDDGDDELIKELAKTHTVRQLADKWECTYREMYRYTYNLDINCVKWAALPAIKRKSPPSDKVKRIIALYHKGESLIDIALKIGKSFQYVSATLRAANLSTVAIRRNEMIAKAESANKEAKNSKERYTDFALLFYGWSREKARYWLKQAKTAPT